MAIQSAKVRYPDQLSECSRTPFVSGLIRRYRIGIGTGATRFTIGAMADKAEFNAELIEGHKGVTVVLVPFDPEEGWSRKPVRLHDRRHGWLIRGTANGVPFDGYIGERWSRFFIIIDRELREAAGASVGDTLRIVIQPTAAKATLDRAIAQSKVTTQPRTARADAIEVRRTRARK